MSNTVTAIANLMMMMQRMATSQVGSANGVSNKLTHFADLEYDPTH